MSDDQKRPAENEVAEENSFSQEEAFEIEEQERLPQEETQEEEIQEEETLSPEELARLEAQEKLDTFVNYIYHQTSKSKVMGEKALKLTPPDGLTQQEVADFLQQIQGDEKAEELQDIKIIEGKKDRYYYDCSIMTLHYAKIDAMLEDKDILHTIAQITRSDSKLYPRPTQFKKLRNTPFRFSQDEILGAVARMKMEEGYEDIDVVTASNGEKATFSTTYLSKKYAQALIESIEVEEPNSP